MPAQPISSAFPNLPELCVSTALRKIDRVITTMYDAELRELDIRITQVSILAAIRDAGCLTATDIGRFLALDRSTLSRTLNRLIERGWVDIGEHPDARVNPLFVTASGHELLAAATPAWYRAAVAAREMLGTELAEQITRRATGLSRRTRS